MFKEKIPSIPTPSKEMSRRNFLRVLGAGAAALLTLGTEGSVSARGKESEPGKELLTDFFVVTGRVVDKETGEGIGTSHKEEGQVMPVPDGNGVIVELRQIVGQNEMGMPVERIISQAISGTYLPEAGSFMLRYQGKKEQIIKDLEEKRLSVAIIDSSLRTVTEVPLNPEEVKPADKRIHQTGFVGDIQDLLIAIDSPSKTPS